MSTISTNRRITSAASRPWRRAARLSAPVLALAAALLAGAGAPASAAAPGDDADPARTAATATDPGLWWIQMNGLSLQDNAVAGVRLTQVPSTANPVFFGVLWHFTPTPAGNAYVVESNNGGCLDIADGISKSPGAGIEVRQCDGTISQQWVTPSHGGAKYGMTNVWSGLAATVKGPVVAGAKLHQRPVGEANQVFDMPFFGF
ncbi:RICIN domain-containing protein [Actinomadura sp. ATCC 31491]|uniref:RICIN domain-containing protein n=1 Tax=Actinomadura luzonensis TaxID=2805427 RepID=A0ABT0G3E5_9ACTN|nr:RICIN domain-containing protein [Actinomadura luzonensis]MCK2218653.1 RICIN domain-containing protein [Actinomadura luzonensis]